MVEFGRDLQGAGTGEIGMHLHAWDTPPLVPLTDDDQARHPPLIAYPDQLLRAKVRTMTRLLEDTFGTRPVSHRAGRWGFDGRYARALVDEGYVADCSVTPHMVWRYGVLEGWRERIVDYRWAPEDAYRPDSADVTRPGTLPLVELPMTVRRSDPLPLRRLRDRLGPTSIVARALARLIEPHRWLRPRSGNLRRMIGLLDDVERRRQGYAQLILHSSELMPGGSPYFPGEADVRALYDDLEALFAHASRAFRGSTVGDYGRLSIGERPESAMRPEPAEAG